MTTEKALQAKDTGNEAVLYMALELSKAKWRVGFERLGKKRTVVVEGGDVAGLRQAITQCKIKFGLAEETVVRSCYEAGRDGFWLHRELERWGVENLVVDPASIEVSRQARRVKSDGVDLAMLLSKLRQHHAGERVWKVSQVPSEEAEAARHLHREAERLKKERSGHTTRIKSLLFAQGIRVERVGGRDWRACLERIGPRLALDLRTQIERESARLALVQEQLSAIAAEQERRVREAEPDDRALAMVRALQLIKAIGPVAGWVFVMEFFGWREFRNGKEVGALSGLTATPYASGQMQREQGISKAGNRRVRALAIEIAWMWVRYQPDSAITRWYNERFGGTGKRHRRVGIVAVARKLLVALWRYLDTGEIPAGAQLKAAV